ncbi:hypothetical protein F4811DRAFT_568899 [Daldinia bambusicola]|nr:hypothetical protein F4811DRAFT_568899 [Daldinia bambusicola]
MAPDTIDTVKYGNAILHLCSYRECMMDLNGFSTRLCAHKMRPVEESLQSAFETLPASDIGTLDCLPLELISTVLRYLDVASYFKFRQVNRRARVLSTRDLYRALTPSTPSCELCENFAFCVFMFTGMRCCWKCLKYAPQLGRIFRLSSLTKIFNLSAAQIQQLENVSLRPLPHWSRVSRRTGGYIAEEQVLSVLEPLGLLRPDLTRGLEKCCENNRTRYKATTVLPWYDLRTTRIEYGISCRGCRDKLKDRGDKTYYIDRFSEKDFLAHFNHCAEAQNIWTKSMLGGQEMDTTRYTQYLYDDLVAYDGCWCRWYHEAIRVMNH